MRLFANYAHTALTKIPDHFIHDFQLVEIIECRPFFLQSSSSRVYHVARERFKAIAQNNDSIQGVELLVIHHCRKGGLVCPTKSRQSRFGAGCVGPASAGRREKDSFGQNVWKLL
jgi:hypothetical protein